MSDVPDISAQVAALGAQVTQLSQALAAAVAQFTPIGNRVNELSGAFLAANDVLAQLRADVTALQQSAPTPDEARLSALEQGQSTLDARITAVEQAKTRGGRLSSRLTNIEDAIQSLVDAQTPPETGGTGE